MSAKHSLERSSYTKHQDLVSQAIVALCASGLGRFWARATGAAYRDGHLIRYGLVGGADIEGILIGGRHFEGEVKTGRAKLSKQQQNFRAMIEKFGGAYLEIRSMSDVNEFIEGQKSNDK